jgi:hypothetical protein
MAMSMLKIIFTSLLITVAQQFDSTVHKSAAAQVLYCDSAAAVAYHKYQCRGLARCKHEINACSVQEAERRGLRACQICF